MEEGGWQCMRVEGVVVHHPQYSLSAPNAEDKTKESFVSGAMGMEPALETTAKINYEALQPGCLW